MKDKFTQYPHIKNLDDTPGIFDLPEVIVTEKIHGSGMRIGLIDGCVRFGGRRLEFTNISPQSKDGQGFVSWALETGLGEKIAKTFQNHDIIFYGEWHGSGTPQKGWPQIQKGIRYIKGNDFRIFDIRLDGKYLSQDQLSEFAEKAGLKTMPILCRGKPERKIFDSFIDTMSLLGAENGIAYPENTMEGIVIRPIQFLWEENREPVMAKHKIGKWAERASEQRHPKIPKQKKEIPAGAKEFAEEFVTDVRLEHILDQLKEENIPIEKSAMGEVMKRMGQDIKREGNSTLINAHLEWKDVSPFVTNRTKELFLKFLKVSDILNHPNETT